MTGASTADVVVQVGWMAKLWTGDSRMSDKPHSDLDICGANVGSIGHVNPILIQCHCVAFSP
jgi:hypothetical protein